MFHLQQIKGGLRLKCNIQRILPMVQIYMFKILLLMTNRTLWNLSPL